MGEAINNDRDVIDSREVIERIEELRALRDDAEESGEGFDPDDAEELRKLEALAKEGEGLADWKYGETLVRESHFTEYAEALAEDISGVEMRSANWPFTHIDWDAAADALRVDYTEIDFDGVTYLAR